MTDESAHVARAILHRKFRDVADAMKQHLEDCTERKYAIARLAEASFWASNAVMRGEATPIANPKDQG